MSLSFVVVNDNWSQVGTFGVMYVYDHTLSFACK